MCQSKANGGRRCTSRTGTGRTNGQATATKTSTTKPAGAVPSREDTDRMAAELPASRRGWDGQPLNEKDRRFFALRDSGYTGPIDQDGYADTTSEGAAILRGMAQQRGENPTW